MGPRSQAAPRLRQALAGRDVEQAELRAWAPGSHPLQRCRGGGGGGGGSIRTACAPHMHRVVRYVNNFSRRWSTGRGVVEGTWWALRRYHSPGLALDDRFYRPTPVPAPRQALPREVTPAPPQTRPPNLPDTQTGGSRAGRPALGMPGRRPPRHDTARHPELRRGDAVLRRRPDACQRGQPALAWACRAWGHLRDASRLFSIPAWQCHVPCPPACRQHRLTGNCCRLPANRHRITAILTAKSRGCTKGGAEGGDERCPIPQVSDAVHKPMCNAFAGAYFLEEGGGGSGMYGQRGRGVWDPKGCVSKTAQSDRPNGTFRFSPTMVPLVWGGGGSRGGYTALLLRVYGHSTTSPERGGGVGMTPWYDDLVCSWRRLLADRHSLPFPWTLSLHRRWCPSASHHPLTVLFLRALNFPLPFPFPSLGLSLRRPQCPSASPHSFPSHSPFPKGGGGMRERAVLRARLGTVVPLPPPRPLRSTAAPRAARSPVGASRGLACRRSRAPAKRRGGPPPQPMRRVRSDRGAARLWSGTGPGL